MHFSKSRYVTVCQQFLVTAVVLGVGLSAAGVMTLQIVAPELAPDSGMAPAVRVTEAFVDRRPVTPEVREVAVAGIEAAPEDRPEGARRTTAPGKKLAALSEPTAVRGYGTVGVTWKPGTDLDEDDIAVQVRTRTGATWSEWTTAEYHDDHGPDAGSAEAQSAAGKVRPGTDAVVVGDVDEVQMKAETTTGEAPEGLELAVVDPGTGKVAREAADIDTADLAPSAATTPATPEQPDAADDDAVSLSAMTVAPKPTIYSRAQWGANESLRDKSSLRYGTIKAGFIHHTVNANSYSASQVPALIRGIYAYHTQSRGWSDIGYNFLVDRFGKIWEGRYGGVTRAVVGAHTLGYNEYAFAMSAIGNFDVAQPPQVMVDAYAALFAWKLSLHDIRAASTRQYVKDRYFPAINGHRDAGKTACPGRYLYAKLPAVRTAAQAIQDRSQAPVDPVTLAPVAPPAGLATPTQAPGPAAPQPAMTFPARTSVTGSAWPDLLVASSTGHIQVVPTEGVLDYTTVVSNPGPWARMSVIAAVGDLTGDRKGDVLAKNRKTKVTRVYPGDGRGHVAARGIMPTRAFKRVSSFVGVHDFDRDRRNDVVGRDYRTGALLLYRGTGNGGFKAPVTLSKRWSFRHTVGVGDVTGDRLPDLVGSVDGQTLYLVPGARSGRALGRSARMTTLPARATALLGWNDLDRDGREDVMARSGGLTTLYAGAGGARLGRGYGPFDAMAGLSELTLSQMTGSGAGDAVGRNAAGRLLVVANNGLRGARTPLPSNLTVTGVTQVLDVGDWDRDGRGDVVVRTSDRDTLLLYPGLGNGKFGRARSFGPGWKPVVSLGAVGDVTGDGLPDLMGRTATGPMTIFPGAGTGVLKPPVLAPATMRTYNQIGSGSWTSRGTVIPSVSGMFVPVTFNDTVSALRTANGSEPLSYDTYVGVGDVNGDAVADLLARERGTGIIWLLPGKTSGGFAPRMWVAAGYAGYRLVG